MNENYDEDLEYQRAAEERRKRRQQRRRHERNMKIAFFAGIAVVILAAAFLIYYFVKLVPVTLNGFPGSYRGRDGLHILPVQELPLGSIRPLLVFF